MYGGENISAPEYKSLASLDGAGFHGGYNHIVYQMVGQPLGVFYLPHCKGLIADGNGGYTYDIADLNGGGVSLEDEMCIRDSLYSAVSKVYEGNTLKDEYTTSFGIRSIEIIPNKGDVYKRQAYRNQSFYFSQRRK